MKGLILRFVLLLLDVLNDGISSSWREMLLELGLLKNMGRFMKHFGYSLIVFTRWDQCTFGATVLRYQDISLHIHSSVAHLVEPSFFQLLPDLLFREMHVII